MIILSIQYNSHDTSVALVKDGNILYAASNERFSRKKMDRDVPLLAIKDCLSFNKISPEKIDQVVFVGEPFPKSFIEYFQFITLSILQTQGKYLLWLKRPTEIIKALILASVIPGFLYKELYPILQIRWALNGYKGTYRYVSHHEAHMYAAYYSSGWKDCLVGCIEGGGIIKTTTFYHVKNNSWTKIPGSESRLPHSAGVFYALSTYLLGFKPVRHEGKITGLSAFGNPKKVYSFVRSLLWVEGLQLKLNYKLWLQTVVYCQLHKKMPPFLQQYKKEDIAAAFQKRLEDCVLDILKKILTQYKTNSIALAGGVVANVKLNQKIHELPIKNIYIFPAMGDDGIALGAALFTGIQHGMKFKKITNVYLGPEYSDSEIKRALIKRNITYSYHKNIEKEVASLLAQGHIVARFNGRMEYGPRALGNRSILCQAKDPHINTSLNNKLQRTEFMPFAPVVLKEFARKCFNNLEGAEHAAKFMTITFDCTKRMQRNSPAVVHVDNTARPQTIEKQDNESYYKILKEYYKRTHIPVLVNTSFNIHEEPIVCTPDDAIRAFLFSKLDYLAIGNYLAKYEE